jgi:hypothetical protein
MHQDDDSRFAFEAVLGNYFISVSFFRYNCDKQRHEKKFFKAIVDAVFFFGDMTHAFGMCTVTMRAEINIIHIA